MLEAPLEDSRTGSDNAPWSLPACRSRLADCSGAVNNGHLESFFVFRVRSETRTTSAGIISPALQSPYLHLPGYPVLARDRCNVMARETVVPANCTGRIFCQRQCPVLPAFYRDVFNTGTELLLRSAGQRGNFGASSYSCRKEFSFTTTRHRSCREPNSAALCPNVHNKLQLYGGLQRAIRIHRKPIFCSNSSADDWVRAMHTASSWNSSV